MVCGSNRLCQLPLLVDKVSVVAVGGRAAAHAVVVAADRHVAVADSLTHEHVLAALRQPRHANKQVRLKIAIATHRTAKC